MMDWNSSSSSTNENDSGDAVANTDFSNLNTTNYDTNLNLNLNQLSQLISLNTGSDLISNEAIIAVASDSINTNLGKFLLLFLKLKIAV